MVAPMSGLLRLARPSALALLALTLALGINGLEGAIHSVHHLSAPATAHPHETDSEEDERSGAPEEPCQVAAAASHMAAIAAEALPVIGPSTAEVELVPLRQQDAPRAAQRAPAHDRAPPSPRPLPS